jgi:hypothetical protein
MATGLTMFLKKNFLWILLFGSLIGLNEALIGSLSFPYRSVVLSAITIALLSFARIKIQQSGTSALIIFIAVLFKLNNFGFHSCTANVLLCGPTALLMLGLSFELFASLLIKKSTVKYLNYSLTCGITAIVAFSLFGLMSTFILGSWGTNRLIEYIFIKGSMTAIASIIISAIGIFTTNIIKNRNFPRLNPYFTSSILGVMVIALWLIGSLTKF